MLKIQNLSCKIENNQILNKFNLTLREGEIHALMGPNGSGKSTIANILMGNPIYDVTEGTIEFTDKDLLSLSPNKRAQLGLFLAFQYPMEIPGVNFGNFLRLAFNSGKDDSERLSVHQFRKLVRENAKMLNIDDTFLDRNLNEGFSGGEKKKAEILQLAVLRPKLAILDETDSGLDVDALKVVFNGIKKIKKENPQMALLIITHYNRVFEFLKPEFVHIMSQGHIIKEGGYELATQLDEKGYKAFIK